MLPSVFTLLISHNTVSARIVTRLTPMVEISMWKLFTYEGHRFDSLSCQICYRKLLSSTESSSGGNSKDMPSSAKVYSKLSPRNFNMEEVLRCQDVDSNMEEEGNLRLAVLRLLRRGTTAPGDPHETTN